MATPQPTINENPTVLSVDPQRKAIGVTPAQCQQLFFGSGTRMAATTVSDRAVQQALRDAAGVATKNHENYHHGTGSLTVLRNLGVLLPAPPADDNNEKDTMATSSRDASFVYNPPLSYLQLDKMSQETVVAKETSSPTETEGKRIVSNQSANDKESNNLTADEVFEIIRNIQDPEHPLTLEQLGVVSREQIVLEQSDTKAGNDDPSTLTRPRLEVRFTPTIPHCSMATQIGLCLRVKLDRSLPPQQHFHTTVKIEPGTHASEHAINKQLADKERVCAALENQHLRGVVNRCIRNGMTGNMS